MSTGALAAEEGAESPQEIQSVRVSTAPKLDGRLDEEVWASATPFRDFVQHYPQQGGAPTEATEARILFDDDFLYVGIRCQDSQPALVNRQLGRRDSQPVSDYVAINIDPSHNHRSGYRFIVNASGVLSDLLLFGDYQETSDWDAVWDARTVELPDGWSAELAIPLRALRLQSAPVQTWGFMVQRFIARRNEEIHSVRIPRDANVFVSKFGHLTGLRNLEDRRQIELVPYLATRAAMRPQYSDASRPQPRLTEPTFDLGLDLRAMLTQSINLTATLNPDFGQVEADNIVLNLTNFELFFQERRPFFTQGLDIFEPVGEDAPHQLFYSRRIGSQAPILGAVKMVGRVSDKLEIGILNTLVSNAYDPTASEDAPGSRLRYNLERPLHLGPGSELPTRPVATTNYFAAVLRGDVATNSTVGGMVTSAVPLTSPCTEEDLEQPTRPAGCGTRGGNAAALDWNLRTADGAWGVLGQVDGSQIVGGVPSSTLQDGTVLNRGDFGYGMYVKAGKQGGGPWRFNTAYRYASPKLELNATGFLRTQNEQRADVGVSYVRPNGMGSLLSARMDLNGFTSWTTDGRGLIRTAGTTVGGSMTLPNFQFVGVNAGFEQDVNDVREIARSGVAFERPPRVYGVISTRTNRSRMLSGGVYTAAGYRFSRGASTGGLGWTLGGNLLFQPSPSFTTTLAVENDRTENGPRWVDELTDGAYLFGDLQSNYISMTLRQTVVFTPQITLQAFAQLFTSYERYSNFTQAAPDGGRIRLGSLAPLDYTGSLPDVQDTQLNLNAVLRWEYRLGSMFYLVYTHARTSAPFLEDRSPPRTLLPERLGPGPATDVVLLKWSYWWSA
ncbi:DUF5916 domain-containing protein [Pyxidicoccus trucidator]|uniref:DUF5916 domain-containing protein n=1 Tax=Pyxidicoccus trucidator TaxID=2709662 RepID=UPI0013DC352F|nr:DUF5916 domain-containing protein [Pyxidicoccus trucidator]